MKKSKKRLIIYPMVLIAFAAGITSCKPSNKKNTSSEPSSITSSSETSTTDSSSNLSVEITVTQKQITIDNDKIYVFDYTSLFAVKVDGKAITVTKDMIDASKVINKEGTYEVVCSYKGEKAVVLVTVKKVETVVVKAKVSSVEIKLKEIDNYDFTSLFTVTEKNRPVTVTKEMITSTIKKEEGTYQVTCTYKNVSKTIEVIVTENYRIEIFESYTDFTLTLKELESLDYTTLFSLYVDGRYVDVTNEMIDKSEVVNPNVGSTFNISMSYEVEGYSLSKTTTIKIVAEKEIIANSHNLIIYPNGKTIDLTSLFTITEQGKEIEVDSSMISGHINYEKIGQNIITLNYKGITKEAIVEVKKGVQISYATSNRILIKEGTNQQTYSFANDFIVSVNGTKFNLSDSFVDTSKVDFSKAGEYEATISIPYGDKNENQAVVNEEYKLSITYVVNKINAVISVINEIVTIASGTTSFNYLKNVISTVNGNNLLVTDNIEWATDPTCTYAKVVSDPIDLSKSGKYEVKVETYPYGLEKDPITVSYYVIIESGVVISESDKTTVFAGNSYYPKDFFVVTKNGKEVEITNEMVEGKVDFSKPGVYTLTLNYEGETGSAEVVVLDPKIKGTYSTSNTTIVKKSTTSSSGIDDEYQESTGEESEEEIVEATPLGDLIIDDNGIKSIDGKKTTNFDAIDENTILFSISTFEYYLHYQDGIIICTPINNNKMQYSEFNRPFVYFNKEEWEIVDKLTINSSSNHVFACDTVASSIDLVKIKKLSDDSTKWFGIKYDLFERYSSDYYYSYEMGDLDLSINIDNLTVGNSYTIKFLDKNYLFKLESEKEGKLTKIDAQERKYANMTFTGTIDSKEAILSFNENQNIKLTIDGEEIFSLLFNNYVSTKLGGIDYDNNTIKVYSDEEGFSYIFNLDLKNSTFVAKEKTELVGLFKPTNSKNLSSSFFFFDGYGNGLAGGLDNATYSRNIFTYEIVDGLLYIDFINARDTFTYADGIVARIDSFNNVIRVIDSQNKEMIDLNYVNRVISDGAYVTFTNNVFEMSENIEDFESQLFSSIEIVTKNGIVAEENKANYIDYSYVNFNQPGFYSVVIKTNVNNEEVNKYYGIQILTPEYLDHYLVGEYQSASDSKYSFKFDVFGNATLKYNNSTTDHATYKGAIKFIDDTNFTFIGTDQNDETKSVNVKGIIEANGVVSLKVSGSKDLYSYFYKDTVTSKLTGCSNHYLRLFINGDEKTYFFMTNYLTTGQKVNVTSINGIDPLLGNSIINVSSLDGKNLFTGKVLNWESESSGLIVSDDYKGEYTLNGSDSLILDGFGRNETLTGIATIATNQFGYYLYTNEIVALLDLNTNKICSYALVNKDIKSYQLLSKDYENIKLAGNYSDLSFNGLVNSKYSFSFDEFGVGKFSLSSSDSSYWDEEYSEDYSESYSIYSTSSTSTSSGGTYVGRIVSVTGNTYLFEGYIAGKPEETIQVSFSKQGDYIIKVNGVNSNGENFNLMMISNYDSPINYVANNKVNYITSVTIENKTTHFYFADDSSAPQIAVINVSNDIAYGTKGSIFSLSVGSKKIIENALYTGSATSTKTGYIFANELKGSYTLENASSILTLDGYAYIEYNTTGEATITAGTRVTEYTYEIFFDKYIKLYNSRTTLYYEINLESKTFKSVSSTKYKGDLLGTYKKVSYENDDTNIVFNGYSFATLTYGSSIYNCVVTHDTSNNSFTLLGDLVNDIYASTYMEITGKEITPGIIEITMNRGGEIKTHYFITSSANYEVYSGEEYDKVSSTVTIRNTLYKVTLEDNSIKYLLAPTDKTIHGENVLIDKESDSPVELGQEGAIFRVSDSSGTIMVCKYLSNSLNKGFVQANLDQRKTYTSSDGKVLFTDGFTISESERGIAYLDNVKYGYYYSTSLQNTIILYDDTGNVKYYVEINPVDNSFALVGEKFSQDSVFLKTFRSMYHSENSIVIDKFSYGKITLSGKEFFGKFIFNSSLSEFSFVGAIPDSDNTSIECVGKVLNNGVIRLSSTGHESTCEYFSVGESVMYGYRWSNFIYSTTVDGVTTYYYALDRDDDPSTYIGEVKVQLLDPSIPFGTEGCIFSVKSLDETITYLTGKIGPATIRPGNGGYELADSVIGKYSNDNTVLQLDGFGNATIGEKKGTYIFYENAVVVVTLANEKITYLINKDSSTYQVKEYDLLKDLHFVYQKSFPNGDKANIELSFDGLSSVTLKFTPGTPNIGGRESITRTGIYTIIDSVIKIKIINGIETYYIELAIDESNGLSSIVCTKSTIYDYYDYSLAVNGIFNRV